MDMNFIACRKRFDRANIHLKKALIAKFSEMDKQISNDDIDDIISVFLESEYLHPPCLISELYGQAQKDESIISEVLSVFVDNI